MAAKLSPFRAMSRRRTAAEQERIRAQVAEAMAHPPEPEPRVRKVLSCGHEDEVAAALDPEKAICHKCKMEAMRWREQ
jgi:hypothetical protein